MADKIQRPLYFEGQILGAADLALGEDHGAGRAARHERYEHTWGIVVGLELSAADATTASGAKYKSLTLKAGVAINGSGREVVVPADEPLGEEVFLGLNVATTNPDDWYPVFLVGQDVLPSGQAQLVGACGTGQPSRATEDYQVTFGRPADALDLDDQEADVSGDVTRGPDGGTADTDRWKVLLGFVQWNGDGKGNAVPIDRFTAVADVNPSNQVSRRYGGVRADEVDARAGALTLRTRAPDDRSGATPLLLALDERKVDRELSFGVSDGQGGMTEVLWVSKKGDVTAAGKISGGDAVQVESGTATDGVVLPLPVGVTPEKVAGGQVVLHVQVTPSLSPTLPFSYNAPATGRYVPVGAECSVDADRRVRCRVLWLDTQSPPANVWAPSACDYMVLATLPPAGS
jgi:hypothetical protein